MQNWFQLTVMAVIQGIAEFLPVSSSGHLVIAGKLFGFDAAANLTLGIFMHTGSLLAIILFYFKLIRGFLHRDQFHLLLMLILGSLPAAAAGITLKTTGAGVSLFNDPLATGMAFMITGMILKITAKNKLVPDQECAADINSITPRQAVIIGLVQMAAIMPGISRSGSTIAAGMFCGVKREDAATFSFLLALPAIAGATVFEIADLLKSAGTNGVNELPFVQITTAILISFAVSLGALKFMVNIVKKSQLSKFSWYMFTIGVAVIIWQFSILNGAK